ncbi:hypothetical protein [Lacrimispora xylanisolvens]|uniref:hypothetical protein n=1 Tax=Lacrimispora xylanisolvens TaxID=384636 RepID=UPI002402B8D9
MVKVDRSYPAPKSLAVEAKKNTGSYSEEDVIAQLKNDFHNKCYICEMNELQDPQVEHLLPHKNGRYPFRKFDWENLFWSCGHCNGVKNREEYEESIINCCIDDPEDSILFRLDSNNVEVLAKSMADRKAVKTAQLVWEIFNIRNTGMRIYKSEMRLKELQKEMNVLYDKLEAYKKSQYQKRY